MRHGDEVLLHQLDVITLLLGCGLLGLVFLLGLVASIAFFLMTANRQRARDSKVLDAVWERVRDAEVEIEDEGENGSYDPDFWKHS
jgi:hypothetical protein